MPQRLLLTTIIWLLIMPAGSVMARSLHWQKLDVEARLDRDGRLHVRESQSMVFAGDWNGGERRFNIRPGQHLDFHRLQRLDSASGAYRDLTRGSLAQVDHYDWHGSDTLRWRSRLPSDPPFAGEVITYALEYSLSGIVRRQGADFVLDHDFVFPERSGPIEQVHVRLDLDPVWQGPEPSPIERELAGLPPGQGLVITLQLQHQTGDPAGIEAVNSSQAAPTWLHLALSGLLFLHLLAAAILLIRHERRLGRFRPLPPESSVTREWLAEHVFSLPPEVVGAAWDKQTGQYEVAAVIARLVQEEKISSRVEEFVLPILNIRIARLANLHMRLEVPRASFSGYERTLVDGLFVDGDETDTRSIRQYYRKKQKVFNPAGELRDPLDKKVGLLTRDPAEPLGYFWVPAAALAACGFFLLLAGFFLNRHEIAPTLAGFLAMLFLWMFGFGFAFRFRGSSQPMLLNLVLLLTPATLIAIVFTLLVTGNAGILMSAGLFCFAAAFIHNILNLAKSRDDQEGVLLCQQLTAARAYFRRELEKDRPDLEDAWFPYLMAFGLGDRVDSWFQQYGDTGISGGSLASSGGGTSGFTGGGGRFGGGGASGAWMTAVGSVAAGSSSSSSGGGGGSSGGGGGGGW